MASNKSGFDDRDENLLPNTPMVSSPPDPGRGQGRRGAPRHRALQGAFLALGAPVGWFALRLLSGQKASSELENNTLLYLYLLVATTVAFVIFGIVLGRREEQLAELNSGLREDALRDELTGLHNLRYFRARLDEEVATVSRNGGSLAMLMLDLDRFKRINDHYGHPEGDRVLRLVSKAIGATVRQGETAARVGGEEFALLLPGVEGPGAVEIAERVRSAVAAVQFHPSSGGLETITVSVGCASTSDLGELSAAELYTAADYALYEAKQAGRDRSFRALHRPPRLRFTDPE